jgi:antitoxin (DNA-binding transcriptional repressor) of toxin-antitoxin stability system
METVSISVTEASRNFADCVSRTRYQGTTFILHKGGAAVAHLVPAAQKQRKGIELAAAIAKALDGVHLDESEATSWLHDLEQARVALQPQVRPWRF